MVLARPLPRRAAAPLTTALPTPWPYPRWFAHRGAGTRAPENTLAAFRLGAAHGFTGFECDVKLSADGVPFLLHDDDLDRTTDATGPASQRPWAALARLDAGAWHGPAFAAEPLPMLADIAAFCLAHDLALDIELKPAPGADEATGRTVAQAARALWQHARDRGRPWPLLSSFSTAALASARDAAPQLPRALLLDRPRRVNHAQAAALGCVAVVLEDALVDAATVAAEHRQGRRVLVYTVNDAERARLLWRWGVDGLITDGLDLPSRPLPGPPSLKVPPAR